MFRSTKRASTAGRGAAAPIQPGRGFLLKRGKGNKDFQRRFFVLQGAQLSYFETDDTGRAPKGQVVVASVRHAAKADAPECDDAQIGAAFVYTDPDGMATVVRTEGGADAKVEWLRVLAAATGGDKAARVKVADYFGSAADAWAENQKRLNVVAASHRRFSSGGGGGDDSPAGERTSSSPAGSPEKPASPPKRGSIVDRRGSVRGSAVGGSTAARDPDEALASVAEGAKLNASGEAAAAQAAYERALGLAGYAPASTQPQPAALCALFELGSIAAAAGDVAAAAARFEGALAIAPKECAQQVKLQLAWAKWQGGKRDEAARFYAEVLEEDVLCMPALLDRARFSMRGGGWAAALSDLEVAISLGEDSADAWNDCGVCRFESGQPDEAFLCYSQALRLHPDHAAAYVNRAICLKVQGKLDEALEDYTKALDLAPGNANAWNNRGVLLEQQGKNSEALKDFTKALQLDAHNANALGAVMRMSDDLVGCASHTGHLEKRGQKNKDLKRRYFLLHGATLSYFESEDGAKKAKPKPKGQLTVVSVGHAKNSDLPEMDQSEAGQTLIGNSIKLGSPDGKTVIVFAETAEEKIGWLKALLPCRRDGSGGTKHTTVAARYDAELQAAREGDEEGGWAEVVEGSFWPELPDIERGGAQACLERALALAGYVPASTQPQPAALCALFELGKLAAASGDYGAAAARFDAALAIAPAECIQQVKLALAAAHTSMGGEKIHDAARLYTEVLEDDPLCVGALIGRATFGTALSWYARSVCDYSLAIALGEHSASTFDGCGTMRLALGHSGDACKDFQKALSLDAGRASACTGIAHCLKMEKKYSEAEGEYTKALSIDSTSAGPDVGLDCSSAGALAGRGSVREELGKAKEALEDYKAAINLDAYQITAIAGLMRLSGDGVVAAASHSGYMDKRGQVNTDFKKRYFLLHGAQLTYYESEEAAASGAKPKGQALVEAIRHAVPDDAPECDEIMLGRSFAYETRGGGGGEKVVMVRCETADQKMGWLKALTAPIKPKGHKKPVGVLERHKPQLTAAKEGGDTGGGWLDVAEGVKLAAASEHAAAQASLERALALAEYKPASTQPQPAALCALFEMGKLASATGNHEYACARFEGALAIAPKECLQQVRLQLAWSKWHSGAHEEASHLYAAVTSDDPICKAVMLDRARKNLSLGRWHWALADLEMAVALGEDSADVWNDVGVCRLETGDDDAALEAYSKAASIAPDHPQAYANKSICLRRKGDLAEAEVAATKAIELAPKAAGNYAGRGTVREQKGDTEGAIADFKTALELDPHNATVLAAVMRLSSDLVGAASLSGYLDKRGQVNKDFKKRYFLLHGAQLTYYDGEEAARSTKGKAKGQAVVTSVGHAQPDHAPELYTGDPHKPHRLGLAFRYETTGGDGDEKTVVVLADNSREKVKWMRALLDASGTTTAAVAPAAKYASKLEAAARGALTEDEDEKAAAWAAVAEGRALVAKGDAAAAQAACEKALALAAYRPPAKTTSPAAGRPGLLTKQRSGVGLLARQASGLSKAGIVQPDAKSAARAGWLQKRGQVNTAFQRRYFLLNDSTLTYYDSEEGAKRGKTPKGQLSVVSVGHARKEDAPNLSAADLTLAFKYESSDGKNVVVKAGTAEEKFGWMEALASQIPAEATGSSLPQPAALCALHELGEIAMAAGDLAAAAARFAAALEIAPPECTEVLKLANAAALWQQGKVGFAVGLYRELLNADPLCAKALVGRAKMNIRGGLWSIALSDLSIALALGEEGADVWACSARCRLEMGDATLAGADCAKVLEQDPTHVDALVIRGTCHTAGGRFDAAATDFEVAIKKDPTSAKAFSARGQLKAHPGFAGKMTDALDDFNTALKLDPRDGSALSGLFAHDDQWVDKAAHSGWLQKRGQVNTDFKKRYFLLHGAQLTYYDGEEAAGGASGKGTTRTSNMKGQLLIDSVAHARASDAPEVWMKDGLTLSEQLTLGLALRISSPDGKDVILLCESEDEKLNWIEEIQKVCPKRAPASVGVMERHEPQLKSGGADGGWLDVAEGSKLAAAGDGAAALASLERALTLSGYVPASTQPQPASLCALFELGKLLASTGEYAAAAARFEGALAIAPKECAQQVRLQLAWAKWHHSSVAAGKGSNERNAASQLYGEILEDDPLCRAALLDRGRFAMHVGMWGAALSFLRLGLAIDGGSADAWNDCGVCRFELGQVDEALECYTNALEIDESHAPSVSNRGNCLRHLGKLQEAERDYQLAIEMDPSNAKSFANRGALLRQQGKNVRALDDFRRVLALEPADQDALKSVHELTEKLKSMGVAVEPGPRRQSQVGDRASTLMRTATMLKSNRLSVSGHRLSIAAGGAPKDRQSVVAEGGGGSPAARRGSVAERTSVVAAGNAAGDQLQTTSL